MKLSCILVGVFALLFQSLLIGAVFAQTAPPQTDEEKFWESLKKFDNEPLPFATLCKTKDELSVITGHEREYKHTIDVMLEVAGTQDCQKAESKLKSLESLVLYHKRISDLSPLASLTNLIVLDLTSNNIVDVKPLASLTNLSVLNLSYNKIVDVKPLAGLSKLTELDLSRNQIRDVTSLAGLSKLTTLNLRSNPISSQPPKPKSIAQTDNSANDYLASGVKKFNSGDFKSAIADFDRAINLNPNFAISYHYRGINKDKLGDRSGAIVDWNKAAELYRQQGNMNDYQTVIKLVEDATKSTQVAPPPPQIDEEKALTFVKKLGQLVKNFQYYEKSYYGESDPGQANLQCYMADIFNHKRMEIVKFIDQNTYLFPYGSEYYNQSMNIRRELTNSNDYEARSCKG